MSKSAAALGGAAAAAAVISVAEAREWVHLVQEVAKGDSALVVFGMFLLFLLGYLLFRQIKGGDECGARVRQLESVVQGMYALLATDDRYQGLPPYLDFAAGNFSIADIHRSRSKSKTECTPRGAMNEVRT